MPTGIIHGLPLQGPGRRSPHPSSFNAYRHYPWAATMHQREFTLLITGFNAYQHYPWAATVGFAHDTVGQNGFNAYRHYPWAATLDPGTVDAITIVFQCLPALSMGCHCEGWFNATDTNRFQCLPALSMGCHR